MKTLLKILLGGFVVFMALAIAQEWEYFSSAWFGSPEPEAGIDESERKAAADTVHMALSVMAHLYSSGGDRRFADRMPASEHVVREVTADIDYLRGRHLRQEMELERLEITSVEPSGDAGLEIRSREYWRVQIFSVAEPRAPQHPRAFVTRGKYLLARGDRGWRIDAWDLPQAVRDDDVRAP